MKIIVKKKENTIIRFDRGEDAIKSLIDFCDKQKISAAYFTGLGACESVTLSYYDLKNKKYLDKKFDEDLEIVSLTGNVAKLGNETVIHSHGVFGKKDCMTIGGHIKTLLVSATCEIHLSILKGSLKREHDTKTGLNLLQ